MPIRVLPAHGICTLHAPCSWEGNVYLLGAAGHQALLQPEGLLLGACLGVVVSHQAPLDLEMMEREGSGMRMWLPLPLAVITAYNTALHLLPDVLGALRGAAVGLRDVAHGEGHEAQGVVAVKW